MQKNGSSPFFNTRTMTYMSMLIALYACLSLITLYITQQLRFSFTFIPVAIASILFGPLGGGLTGALGDILGWFIAHPGAYFPGLTISGFVTGIIYGIFLYKKITITRVIFAAVTIAIVVELLLNTLWLSIMFGNAFIVLLGQRLIKVYIFIPMQILFIFPMKFLIKRLKTAPQK